MAHRLPGLPGQGSKCRNCQRADARCDFIEKSPNEIHLQNYTVELQDRIKHLEDYISSSRLTVPVVPRRISRGAENDLDDSASENLATGVGFLSLNGAADPLYLGGSSGVGWAKVLMQSLRQRTSAGTPRIPNLNQYQVPGVTNEHSDFPLPPPENLGNHYISTVYYRIQARYGFLDWLVIQSWQSRAKYLCSLQPFNPSTINESDKVEDYFGSFFLWMLYGLGSKLSENDNIINPVSHEEYYNCALRHFVPLSNIKSISTVQALLLLIVYTFRHTSSEFSLWHTGGLAIRSAIELGLHRKIRSKHVREKDPRAYCMRQRVWWGAYILDRMIAIQFGRPFAIQDRDIDIELPVNLDANIADQDALCELLTAQALMPETNRPGVEYRPGYGCFTSMTSFIHTVRLNQLKSKIHELVYTVDRPSLDDTNAVQALLNELNMWRGNYPPEPDNRVPACSHEFFEVEYHNVRKRGRY
ncbi:uncharacterized protein IL334_002920 [Kwoniella shivajii]|uniref:Xylanolytic transcriptional activator regulatory domain-containing protein n=1 Tax=Kwoniella shivajii TaxID=564305 RepID=A0ABZ1CXC6_9TREE|nr:hypothetical protein IL334_002920 [Kwoniella shivajii]